MKRLDGRKNNQLRAVSVHTDYTMFAQGSILFSTGNTKVICTAMVEDKIPPFIERGSGKGWVTSEYSMLPGSSNWRIKRATSSSRPNSRAIEIQRLIGRSLRSVIDLNKLGERTIWIDCDVIQADGGTRTASITGGFIALRLAVNKLLKQGLLKEDPIKNYIAATSVGILNNEVILDICYEEDSTASVDMNIVMTDKGEFTEIQGTGEEATFTNEELKKLISSAKTGIKKLIKIQKKIVEEYPENRGKLKIFK